MTKCFLFVISVLLLVSVSSLITSVILYKQWQTTRYILEKITLQEPHPTSGKPLIYFTNLLEKEIFEHTKKEIEFVFYTEDLKGTMPMHKINIEGTLFIALSALEHTYMCNFEFAESSIIVRPGQRNVSPRVK